MQLYRLGDIKKRINSASYGLHKFIVRVILCELLDAIISAGRYKENASTVHHMVGINLSSG